MSPIRSWLFVPGDRPDRIGKALASDAQAVIVDLEDAVAASAKAVARSTTVAAVAGASRADLFVRINSLETPFAFDDIASVVPAHPSGVMLPKAASGDDIRILDWTIHQFERASGIDPGTIEIVPIIETATGVANALPIGLASPRIRCLAFGAGDFTLDLGLVWSADEHELLPARNAIALASREAGIGQPVDAVWIDVGDETGMTASAMRSRAHGFQGKLCIHPKQVGIVHAAYRPSAEAVAQARRVVETFAEAEESGAAAIQVDGRMVDYPVYEAALRTIADARL